MGGWHNLLIGLRHPSCRLWEAEQMFAHNVSGFEWTITIGLFTALTFTLHGEAEHRVSGPLPGWVGHL